jgi:alkyl sulfatase BDS1-like metallo-beta-lactamase superfamily hydrolase
MTGPIFGHVPNLYTLRGDHIRYVQWFLDSVQRVIDLEPATLITGHGEPIRGVDEIRRRLTQIRDAAQYLRDKTFEGMNAGVDLWTLMGSIKLPPELNIPQGHGKIPWIVRAIWEEHLGWFRYESRLCENALCVAAWRDGASVRRGRRQARIASMSGPTPMMAITRLRL